MNIEEKTTHDSQGYREASALAQTIFDSLYAGTEPYKSGSVVWELCDTTAGVISQIDNMIAPLVHQRQAQAIAEREGVQPAAVPQGWAMEAVEDGIRLTAPDGERWRFRETDGSDLFVFKFLRAMLDAAPTPADHFPDARKMVQAAQQQEPGVCDKDPRDCWYVRCQLGGVCKNTHPASAQQEPTQCEVGPDHCQPCQAEVNPAFDMEDVRKLYETIERLAQTATTLQVELVAAQPSPWVGLTDADREAVFKSLPDALEGFLKKWGWLHFAKAIEEACRAKNEVKS